MDWVWQTDTWLGGWMLPAGSALVALGLTTLAAAAYARWRMRGNLSAPGGSLDLRDEAAPATVRARETADPVGLDAEIERLERELQGLRRRLEAYRPESVPRGATTARETEGSTLRRMRTVEGVGAASSPEVEALRALVAESR